MASLRKRNGRWQVQVRRAGAASLTKTFDLKKDALAWARERERALDLGAGTNAPRLLEQMTFGDLLKRYGEEITPKKRGAKRNVVNLVKLHKQPCQFTPETVVEVVQSQEITALGAFIAAGTSQG